MLHIRDVAGVSIAPVAGEPAAVAKKLSAAIAKALLKHDIPASDRTANLDSYQLYGRLAESAGGEGGTTVAVQWRLYDGKGRAVGESKAEAAAPADAWNSGSDAPIERLAGLSADQLAPLIEGKTASQGTTAQEVATPGAVAPDAAAPAATPAAAASEQRSRVAIGTVSGAPGDGAKSLAAAAAVVLRRMHLDIVAGGDKPDLLVDADISVSPGPAGKQHVKIVWHVRRANGGEIGTVGQENDVPKGLLDGAWGDIAYTVAIAAGDGLMQLVARGAPPAKS